MANKRFLCLDVGTKRIGVAEADDVVRIAIALDTIDVDGTEIEQVLKLVTLGDITDLIIGYPRNQSGEPTAQTRYAERFAELFHDAPVKVSFQDESLTSVLAEQRLKEMGKPYTKGDIDAQAACIILEDYLERHA